MSLNGLDDAKVAEAYQAALAEAGGWFLLKYASRDAVEILTRGAGGAAEVRTAVAQYDEKSPLYGFLLYRRRKVLIKYIPDGTSRLLQARVAVHFTAVTEKFTPHDSTISITTADELSDTALSAACSLHTAAPSSCSSSGSSRRHKLDEITEDAEEGPTAAEDGASQTRPDTADTTHSAAASTIPTIGAVETPDSKAEDGQSAYFVPRSSSLVDELKPTESKSSVGLSPEPDAAPAESKDGLEPIDYRENLSYYDSLFENGPAPRLSSQTARPALDEMYAEIYAKYNKPKVKLGPRPKQSLDIKRPHTSGTGSQSAARPVSSLPAGLRAAGRKPTEQKRPKSRDSSTVPSIAFPPPPPVPAIPEMPHSPSFPPKSPASVKSMPIPSYSSHHRSSGVTPEKQRLMKALELRKKQMKAVQKQKADRANEEIDSAKEATDETPESSQQPIPNEASEDMATATEEASVATEPAPALETAAAQQNEDELPSAQVSTTSYDKKTPLNQEDSGVDLMASQMEADDRHSAASACSPTSAQTQGSSAAPSTRPSSISEDDRQLVEDVQKTLEGQLPGDDDVCEASNEPLQAEDEKLSVESSPTTVVPESITPVPSVEISEQPESTAVLASVSDDALARKTRRESIVVTPPEAKEGGSRRSKRESMIFMPSNESPQTSRRQKRESMIMPMSRSHSQHEALDRSRLAVDPLHFSAENSEAEYLSDDSFMEELQSAKVEEAKPVSVSKSPITSFFPRKSNGSELSVPERSVSQVYHKPGRFSPEQQTGRKTSGPWLTHANTDTVVVAKKINVSSGISQRIKALAEKSNRESTASVSALAIPDASNSLVAQRKSSFFSTPLSTPSAGNSPNGKPVQRISHASFANPSTPTTPDQQPVLQPPPTITEQPVYHVKQDAITPDSVQVTARIVRDGRAQIPALTMPTEGTPLELHQSPITIDHQKPVRPPSSKQSPSRVEPASPRPPSSSHSREQSSSALPRSSTESSWRSFGRRLSESRSGAAAPRSQSAHSFDSTEEKREEKKEKKDSRTSKLFKRMSSISAISRKNTSSSNLHEDEMQSTSLPSLREPPPAVQVGDLNIQFPDTLLWKRRWVEIDAMGNLVLSASKSNAQSKGIVKRFHLSEMRTPYAPDQDRQELPNSVVLDFFDGRTLQCACETYVAQVQVLQILREAHDAWLAYNQGQ